MKKLVPTVLLLLLAALAILMNSPSAPKDPAPSIFAQGALEPLVQVEASLKAGNHVQALQALQVALLRTRRDDKQGLFNRIRFRLGWAGKDLAPKNFKDAWPLLERYALFAPNFGRTSRRLEGWCLSRRLGPKDFRYALISSATSDSFRLSRPVKAPLWLYRELPDGFPLTRLSGGLYGASPEHLPTRGYWSWVWDMANFRVGPGLDDVQVESRETGEARFCLSVNNRIQWTNGTNAGAGALSITPPPDTLIDRLVLTGNLFPKHLSVWLIHSYHPLT